MATLWYHCPHCGEQHLMILGATIVHEGGRIIAKCPHESVVDAHRRSTIGVR